MSQPDPTSTPVRLRLGVSACVLGEPVRHDGGACRRHDVLDKLDPYVEWVPVCPEVGIGLGTPREAVRLVGDAHAPRMVGSRSGHDLTERMRQWSARTAQTLAARDLHGFILKKNSPSCGVERVKVYPEGARSGDSRAPERTGRGLFAAALIEHLPLLPVEEDGRLHDANLCEHFIERAFLYARWRRLVDSDPEPGDLVRFHTLHKLQLMAHSPSMTRQLGQIVGQHAGDHDLAEVLARYEQLLGRCMAERSTRGRRVNVIQHLAGFVKRGLDPAERAELGRLVDEYARGIVPLIVPMTLLSHHLHHPGADLDVAPWVLEQSWLEPYPRALALRASREF